MEASAEQLKDMIDIQSLHAQSEIVEVPLDDLHVDRSYQREPSQTLADDIADDWDEVSAELLLVSDRGTRSEDGPVRGGLFVVNGQHRMLAAKKLGMSHVWARVINLREEDDPGKVEATFRLRTNKRLSDKPLERFKAQLRAGNPESIGIMEIVNRFGTEVNEVPLQETGINAISAVERIYRLDDGRILTATFQVIKDAFGYVGGRQATAAIMSGIAWFIIKHSDESDRGRLVEKVHDAGIAQINNRARTIGSSMAGTMWLNTYRAIVEYYNEKLTEKSRLEWRHAGSSSWGKLAEQWRT